MRDGGCLRILERVAEPRGADLGRSEVARAASVMRAPSKHATVAICPGSTRPKRFTRLGDSRDDDHLAVEVTK